ncbi:Kelch domain protein [Stigmatella aurantiaca DW4/3-1]|uniref:Kelch domain protein n=2 Tax=Stigmatella aurantiaca TaxID=41 RepID=E3FZG7_STIAD|nr:Kelch domain protein [Stigmatella aurantiaca DW4/3-1]
MGCGQTATPDAQEPGKGAASLVAHMNQALSGQLSRVTVTLTAEDAPTRTVALTLSGGAWSGTMFNIPSEPSFENTAPCIDSLVASSSTVRPGGTIALHATAHDPDVGDTLSYSWSSAAGSFSSAGSAGTVWTAPQVEGPVTLTLTVMDSRGAFATASITLTVLPANGAGQGAATFTVSFNFSPSVQNVASSLSPIRLGQSTTVTASASDADGDALSYAWSASCEGAWTNPNSREASFAPSAVPPGESCGNCALTVTVTDGKGGVNTGTLRLCVQGPDDDVPAFPPHIVQTYQSAQSVQGGSPVTLRIIAEDGDGGALTFSWSVAHGSLAAPSNSYTSSEAVWTAPLCAPSPAAVFITATVTNALGFSASHRFSVTVVSAPDCDEQEEPQPPGSTWKFTGSMITPRYDHQAVLLPSGKVLVTAGDHSTAGWLDTAEVYDPASGTWTPAGRMKASREASYTLTVLPSGDELLDDGHGRAARVVVPRLVDGPQPDPPAGRKVAGLLRSRAGHEHHRRCIQLHPELAYRDETVLWEDPGDGGL